MLKSRVKIKTWGHSLGLIIPTEMVKRGGLDVHDEVEVTIEKKGNVIREAFGMMKNFPVRDKRSTERILKEIDDEFE